MFTPQQDMNPSALPLLGQLNSLLGISLQRMAAFIQQQKNITSNPAYHGPIPPNPDDNPALEFLEQEVVMEGQIQGDLKEAIIQVTKWSNNDPTFAAQGVPLTGIDKTTGETINIRLICPRPKPYLLTYLRNAASAVNPIIDPTTVFFIIPQPLPAVTVKPGAPIGATTPWG